MLQHIWTLKKLCYMKEASLKDPHIELLHLYDMPTVNISIETESRLLVGKVGNGREGY